jgi:lipid-A-disaccharide synthase
MQSALSVCFEKSFVAPKLSSGMMHLPHQFSDRPLYKDMKFYIIAGETSGDKHGALLMQELYKIFPDLDIVGLGGTLMHQLSDQVEDWADEAAVVGLVEVLKRFNYFKKYLLNTLDAIVRDKPECLILVDYPGFNLRLAERVHRLSPETKIVYFISPQVWAWHKGRIPKMAKILDLMMCIFPFEKPLFENAGLKTEFVGHPLVDDILARHQNDIREDELIGFFPGSRTKEIERHFPVFIKTAKLLKQTHPSWRFETAASNERLANRMIEMAKADGLSAEALNIKVGHYHNLMDRCSAAAIASGTATLEAALHELPYVLVYKVNQLTYWVARFLIKIRFLGMVNILAQRPVVRELIQGDMSPIAVASELERLMDPNVRRTVLSDMKESVDKLGHGGAATKAAEAIADLLK